MKFDELGGFHMSMYIALPFRTDVDNVVRSYAIPLLEFDALLQICSA